MHLMQLEIWCQKHLMSRYWSNLINLIKLHSSIVLEFVVVGNSSKYEWNYLKKIILKAMKPWVSANLIKIPWNTFICLQRICYLEYRNNSGLISFTVQLITFSVYTNEYQTLRIYLWLFQMTDFFKYCCNDSWTIINILLYMQISKLTYISYHRMEIMIEIMKLSGWRNFEKNRIGNVQRDKSMVIYDHLVPHLRTITNERNNAAIGFNMYKRMSQKFLKIIP